MEREESDLSMPGPSSDEYDTIMGEVEDVETMSSRNRTMKKVKSWWEGWGMA